MVKAFSPDTKKPYIMREYKYSLEKGSKKHVCPNPMCNKKTFVRLVEQKTGNYLPPIFGRCDRQINCGYYKFPRNNTIVNELRTPPQLPQLPQPSFHGYSLVEKCSRHFTQNGFVQFLKKIYPEEAVKKIILRFLLGTAKRWHGATVFWQIDQLENIRAGQIMLYDKATGKKKEINGNACVSWVHSCLKYQGKIKTFNLQQCLFGLHQINESKKTVICIVESAKTACIMSEYSPEFIWMACGNKDGLKHELLKPIRGYKILAIPDNDGIDKWVLKAEQLKKFGFDITCITEFKDHYITPTEDIADVAIRDLLMIKQPKPILSSEEKKLSLLAGKNVAILNLLKTFSLTDNNGENFRLNLIANGIIKT